MHFKVKTSLISKPHNFFQNISDRLNKEWINKRVNNLSM